MVKLIVGEKLWMVQRRMANSIIDMAKKNYKGMNVNAIVAVEKDNIITLQRDVYNETDAFVKAIKGWTKGGYECYYVSKGGK